MSPVSLNVPLSAASTPSPEKSTGPDKIRDAAQQFEALLLAQILRAARQENGNSDDCAMELAEQQLAAAMSQKGGLGLSRLIGQGLGAHKLQE